MFHVNILLMCKTFNIKSEGFPSTHFCCSIFYVNNFGVASVLILSYLTSLLWWASPKADVLMDWTHHNHDQTHQHHSHCFDQHGHQKLTRYRLGGKVGALSHWVGSNICGCGKNSIFILFFFKEIKVGTCFGSYTGVHIHARYETQWWYIYSSRAWW